VSHESLRAGRVSGEPCAPVIRVDWRILAGLVKKVVDKVDFIDQSEKIDFGLFGYISCPDFFMITAVESYIIICEIIVNHFFSV
jgi:hypothetical protein